jgi:Meiotically up-regulated gene 113
MPIDKTHILQEIKRTAAANGGAPLGRLRFFTETGIKESDWLGVHWIRWSEAIREAGFDANQFTKAYRKDELLQKYAELAREIGRLPIKADLRMKARNDSNFPSDATFGRFGAKSELVRELASFCKAHDGYEVVLRYCEEFVPSHSRNRRRDEVVSSNGQEVGSVYLMKSGRFYKIGHSNAAGRREYELSIQLPEKIATIHVIRTDDPTGIEAYWHNRFKDKRKNGEWFDLTGPDVAAFKRRKFM